MKNVKKGFILLMRRSVLIVQRTAKTELCATVQLAHVLVDADPAGWERNVTENAQRLALTVIKWILPLASHVIRRILGVSANITVAYNVSLREINKSVKKKMDIAYSVVNCLFGAMFAHIAVVMAAMVWFVI